MGEFDNLHQILLSLYDEMMPLCADMTGVAKGLAGLGALFYVAMRVWQSLARAEAIDVYPLLRPFALGLCILFFPTIVLGTMNSVLSPIVQGVHGILEEQTFDGRTGLVALGSRDDDGDVHGPGGVQHQEKRA